MLVQLLVLAIENTTFKSLQTWIGRKSTAKQTTAMAVKYTDTIWYIIDPLSF